MELKQYLLILWKRVWLLIAAPLLAGAISYAASLRMVPVYRASATLLVSPSGESAALNYSSLLASERVAKTYAELLTKRPLLEQVIANLHLSLTPRQLAGKINVAQPADTQLLELQVEDSNPQLAVAIANNIADTFVAQHEKRRDDLAVYIEVVEPASMPAYKLRPRPYFNTFVGALSAFLLAVVFIFFMHHLDESLTYTEAEEVLQIPTLATIPPLPAKSPLHRRRARSLPLSMLEPLSAYAEAYRTLRTNLRFAGNGSPPGALLITSALPGEGKTTVAANLGTVMAQAGRKVLLVDADLRHPDLHRLFDVPNRRGVADLLLNGQLPDETWLVETSQPRLYLLPGGPFTADPRSPTPAELFDATRLQTLLDHLRFLAEVIIVDSSPVLEVPDGLELAALVDGVLLAMQNGRSGRYEVQDAVRRLQYARAELLGTVLTRCQGRGGYTYTVHPAPAPHTPKVVPLVAPPDGKETLFPPEQHPG